MIGLRRVLLVMVTVSFIIAYWSVFNDSKDERSRFFIVGDKNRTQSSYRDSNEHLRDDTIQRQPFLLYENDVEKRFEKRREKVKERCKKFNVTSITRRLLLYLKDQKVLYCSIAKIASTFWKKILYTISHPSTTKDSFAVNPKTAYSNSAYTRIKDESDIPDIMDDSVSFLFVRDPYSKLLSGYFSKFYSLKTDFWRIGTDIIKSERSNPSKKSLTCGHDVSFQEYVSYHSKRLIAGKSINSHFSPSIDHCNVCMMDFKYIGKYETLEEDAEYIVNKFNIVENIDIMTNFTERAIVTLIKEQISYMFKNRRKWSRCLSFQCALYRVWKRFKCRGVISKHIPFPYTNQDKLNKVTEDEFFAIAIEAHEKSDPEEIANNRQEVLAEAYRSLDKITLRQMIQAFKDDFDLFDYSTNPDFLKRGDEMMTSANRNDNFSYLQDCPY